mgnify:CR=1 FL=1
MGMKVHIYYIVSMMLALAALAPSALSAQTVRNAAKDRGDVRRGNRDYRKGNYKEAEIDYRKALVKDSMSVAANYNLAADLYRQGDVQGAMKSMQKVEQGAVEAGYGADYYYNLGDMALSSKDYKTAVEAFAKSLIMRPDDLDAKENYIYARKMLENQQQNGGGGGQNDQNQDNQNQQNQDNQDRNNQNDDRQNQDKDDNSQNQDNKDNDNRDGDNDRSDDGQQNPQQPPQDNRDGQGQPQEQKISPQAAQQMLQAIQAKEKETQDKVNKEKAAAVRSRQKEKNW